MTKRARTFIFILFVLLFISAAPSAVFYSQGYRIDFARKKVVQTGGLYFKVAPGRADIYLNDKLKKSTSMITNSAYIENLLPQKYKIEIKRPGYHPWIKNLEVKEREVTEAKNIILFAENPEFAATNQTLPKITAVATSTDKKKVVESDGYEIWVSILENDPPLGSRGEKMFLTRFSEKIGNIFWLNDYYLIFSAGNKVKVAEIDNRDRPNIIDLAEFEKPEIAWDKNAKKLYVVSEKKTYLLENLFP